MKKLLIIVPKGSVIDSYLQDTFYAYDNIVVLDDRTCYIQNGITYPMAQINYLISMFGLKDYFVRSSSKQYTFRVRS